MMAKKIQGKTFEHSIPLSAKDVIQKPQLWIETEGYVIGEREYGILKQWYWVDFLKPFAYGSLAVCLEQIYKLSAFMYQICIGTTEEVIKLKENQGDEIGRTAIILIVSGVVSFVLLFVNKVVRTKKKSLLKDMRYILDRNKKVTARKREGKKL